MTYYKKRLVIQVDISFLLENEMMVNATEMAKPFGAHKRPKEWLRTRQTQDLINALAEGHLCPSADLVRVIKGGNEKMDQGTWIHQDLAFHYALFLDTDFAIRVNKQIKTLLQKGKVELDPDMLALKANNYQKVLNRKDKYRKRGIEFNKILEQSKPYFYNILKNLTKLVIPL